ncbi:MAG: GtrA family protein [Myxococcota bacterium]|nr:GtrA family protein [Myxococcota bacterium]
MSDATVKSNVLVQVIDRLRSPEMMRFVKFAIVGGSGVVVNMGVLWFAKNFLFHNMTLSSAIGWAGFLAIAVSIVTNFLLNDAWTWGDRRQLGLTAFTTRFGKYVMVASIAGVVQWLVLQGLVQLGLHYLLSNMVGIGAGICLNFFLNNWWTFRARPDAT